MATYNGISVSFFILFHFTEMSFYHIAWYWLLVLIYFLTKAFVFTIKDLMKNEHLPHAVAKIPTTQKKTKGQSGQHSETPPQKNKYFEFYQTFSHIG